MDRRTIHQLQEKNIAELNVLAITLRTEITQTRLEQRLGKNKNIHLLTTKRHDLARVLTVLRNKQLKEEKS